MTIPDPTATVDDSAASSASIVYTAGYEGSDPETFVWHLRKHRVATVLDVRDNPVSRNRQFSSAKMTAWLAEARIGYVHLKVLGAPAELRHRLREDGDMTDYFRGYRDHLSAHPDALADLLKRVTAETCVLLCLERDHRRCHRCVLAEALLALAGGRVRIEHI